MRCHSRHITARVRAVHMSCPHNTQGVNLNDPAVAVFAKLEMDYFSTNSFTCREATGESLRCVTASQEI